MYELIKANLSRKVNLQEEDFSSFTSLLKFRKLRKRQYLVGEGEVCEYIAFVNKGMLRSYSETRKGEEYIVQFAPEDYWISDLYSFLSRRPALYNIDALEDSELLLISRENLELAYERIPGIERFFRLLLQNSYVTTQHRLVASLSQTAEEKYLSLLEKHPSILQRVALHQIAAYLGITPESLSRIRRQLLEK